MRNEGSESDYMAHRSNVRDSSTRRNMEARILEWWVKVCVFRERRCRTKLRRESLSRAPLDLVVGLAGCPMRPGTEPLPCGDGTAAGRADAEATRS